VSWKITGRRLAFAGVSERPRVLFICADPVGVEMAGLGIRNWELARALRDDATVTIAHGGRERVEDADVHLVPYRPHDPGEVLRLVDEADVVVAHPQWPVVTRALRHCRARVVFDLYDPETLETLELLAGRSALVRRGLTATTIDRLHDAMRSGHHFMCASEDQRALWLGAMLALRLISPAAYDRDPSFRSIIDVVPFGLPGEPPRLGDAPGPRELVHGLPADAEIVLWNGGIWQWLDPRGAISALALLRERRPRAALVFMGGAGAHPAAQGSVEGALNHAAQLGLLDRGVFFHDAWVPYTARAGWLEQADCAISAAHDHLETRFAFRTRVLDCLWAGLPVACTSGDELAARVAREELGAVAPPGDAPALAAAVETILQRGRAVYAPQLRVAAARMTWAQAAAPLRHWIVEPGTAPRLASDGGLRRPAAQRFREAAYAAAGRRLLSRRAR
jgi:glycosyltransferase involved in cell wall biosynthesis